MRKHIVLLAALLAVPAAAADMTSSLKSGKVELRSAGPIAFAPEGILLVGDPVASAIVAIDTADRTRPASIAAPRVDGLNDKLAALVGSTPQDVLINDLAVNPISGKVYISASRGRGPDATPLLARVDGSGKIDVLALDSVKFSRAELPNAPSAERQRMESITDLAYVDGRVFIAGLSNEEFASRLRSVAFPFAATDSGASIEIYHGNHGQIETRSPVRTFTPYKISGQSYLIAAYTCTPLVKLPVAELRAGAHVKGTTIAELGNRNRPLDMFVFRKDGKDYILMANNSRGVMKIETENIDKIESITSRVTAPTAGLPYRTIEELKGVQQLDRLDETRAVILVQGETGSLNLQTIALP